MHIGILALQGAVQHHLQKFKELDVNASYVRTAAEMAPCDGLVLPGGESTTMLLLMEHYGLVEPIQQFAKTRSLWGVCAGMILMAEQVKKLNQASLKVFPIHVVRNAYGRQDKSFVGKTQLHIPNAPSVEQELVFIRSPKITFYDAAVNPIARWNGDVIAANYQHHLVCSFHPELAAGNTLHLHFLRLCKGRH